MAKHEPLLECPHCGGKSEIKSFSGMFQHGWVGCPVCGIYKNWSDERFEALGEIFKIDKIIY